jgi:nucleotide-binding universal stress UspA family protein
MHVLYATDGSEIATEAGRLLAAMSDREGIEIGVLCVLRTNPPALDADTATASEIVAERVVALGEEGFRATPLEDEGEPGERIVARVERDGYDVVVMGAGRRTWLDRILLGSVSTRVLHASPSSVMIVHRRASHDGAIRIVVGVDGSRHALAAVETLSRLADPDRCDVRLLSVGEIPVPVLTRGPGIGYAASAYSVQTERELRAAGAARAEAAARTLREAGFTTEIEVILGSAQIRLLDRAERWDADLVVVGSRGLGPVERVVLGSVSETIARHAPAGLIVRRTG